MPSVSFLDDSPGGRVACLRLRRVPAMNLRHQVVEARSSPWWDQCPQGQEASASPPAACSSCCPAQAGESTASSYASTSRWSVDCSAFAFEALAIFDPVDDFVQTSLHYDAPNYHFAQDSMQCFEAKYQV